MAPVEWIDVHLPYEPGKRLEDAYNRAVLNSKAEWVLLLDHDLYLCNPYWYLICLKAVNELKEDRKAALITCATNGIHKANRRTPQRADIIDNSSNLRDQISVARKLYQKYGPSYHRISWSRITGFFMLVKTVIAQEIGFRRGDSGKLDWNFGIALTEAGYHSYLLPGLYVYHNRGTTKGDTTWKGLPIAEYEVPEC